MEANGGINKLAFRCFESFPFTSQYPVRTVFESETGGLRVLPFPPPLQLCTRYDTAVSAPGYFWTMMLFWVCASFVFTCFSRSSCGIVLLEVDGTLLENIKAILLASPSVFTRYRRLLLTPQLV